MASKLWWLIHKDLMIEYRTRQTWTSMLLLCVIIAVVFSLQVKLPMEHRTATVSTMLWLAIIFASQVVVERTGIAEHQDGCWDAGQSGDCQAPRTMRSAGAGYRPAERSADGSGSLAG